MADAVRTDVRVALAELSARLQACVILARSGAAPDGVATATRRDCLPVSVRAREERLFRECAANQCGRDSCDKR
jgi:hypothetical protein